MERLTNKNHTELGFCAYVGAQNPFKTPLTIGELAGCLNVDYSPRKILEDIFDRLAAYEDTGLEPETCAEYKKFEDEVVSKGATFKRILELVEAEKDGRLVVLPCKAGDLLYEVDLPKYGVITCRALEIHTYTGPAGHVPGAPMVSTLTVSVEVVAGHGKGSGYTFETLDFGENIFLTREEAEAALKKREGADNARSNSD